MGRPVDTKIVGQRFGELVAVKPVGHDRHGNVLWLCECSCGNTRTVARGVLGGGNATHCGCKTSTHRAEGAEQQHRRARLKVRPAPTLRSAIDKFLYRHPAAGEP